MDIVGDWDRCDDAKTFSCKLTGFIWNFGVPDSNPVVATFGDGYSDWVVVSFGILLLFFESMIFYSGSLSYSCSSAAASLSFV